MNEIEPELARAVNNSYAHRRIYQPDYTWSAQTSYSTIISENEKNLSSSLSEFNKETLIKNLSTLFNKINATFYHLQQLKFSEETAIKLGKEMSESAPPEFKQFAGVTGMTYEPISYEYEALLTTAKTALDILTIIIAKNFNREEDNIVSLLSNLTQIKRVGGLNPNILEIKKVLSKPENAKFLSNFKREESKRNYAVHNGSLPIGTINIPINNPKAKIAKSKAYDHRKSRSEQIHEKLEADDLIDYCENTFYSMADLVIECLEVLLDTKFERGEKKARQEI